MIHPQDMIESSPAPALTIVPPSLSPPSPQQDESPLAPPPELTLGDIDTPDNRRTVMAPLDPVDIGGPAFPDFLGDVRLDTVFTAQPHWLSDSKGEPFTFRLNPGLARLITILVESNATPYRSKSDFFRDAAYYLARAIRDLVNLKDQRLDSLLQEAELRAESDYEARLQEEVVGFEHDLTDAIIGCLERGALAEACRKIDAFWAMTDNIDIPHRRKAHQSAMTNSPLIQAVLALGRAQNLTTAAL